MRDLTFRLPRRYSLSGVESQHPRHQMFGTIRYPPPGAVNRIHLPQPDLGVKILLRVSGKRRTPAEEDVEDDTGAPHVCLGAVAAVEDFGGEVEGAAHQVGQRPTWQGGMGVGGRKL